MTEPTDPALAAFLAALPRIARQRLNLTHAVVAAFETAHNKGADPAELATTVSTGIGWYDPVNAHELMLWRLRRAAGTEEETV